MLSLEVDLSNEMFWIVVNPGFKVCSLSWNHVQDFCSCSSPCELLPRLAARSDKFLQVTEDELKGWTRRSVLFGSSIGSICRGMTEREVSHVFRRCLVCVRAYVPATGEQSMVLCTPSLRLSFCSSQRCRLCPYNLIKIVRIRALLR